MKKEPSSLRHNGNSGQRGSAIVIILMAVFMLAALYYAFSQGTRANLSVIEAQKKDAAQIASTDCQTALAAATKRLQLRGCGTLISSEPDGSNPNPGAPKDGSCSIYHLNGGGVKNCQGLAVASDACDGSPAPGQICGDGSVFAGPSPVGGQKIYTTPADMPSACWNKCANSSGGGYTVTGATSDTDGAANTALLASLSDTGAPYQAALACANLTAHGKSDWYLPASEELNVLVINKDEIGGFFTTGDIFTSSYWSSTETYSSTAALIFFNTDGPGSSGKQSSKKFRCVRRD